MSLLLYLGAFFLFIAALTFTAFGWQDFGDVIKTAVVTGFTVALFGVSILAARLDLEQAEATFFWVGVATVPVSVGSFVSFVLGVPLELHLAEAPWWEPRWLFLELVLTAGLLAALHAWKRRITLRAAVLGLLAFAPMAQFLTVTEVRPVVLPVTALAYTLGVRAGRETDWGDAAKSIAASTAVLGLVVAGVSSLYQFGVEFAVVQVSEALRDSVEFAPAIALVVLAATAWMARSKGWWDSKLPEAGLIGAAAAVGMASFGVGATGEGWRLFYLVPLAIPCAYVATGRSSEALASGVLPFLVAMALSPWHVFVRVFYSVYDSGKSFGLDDLLPVLAVAMVSMLVVASVWRETERDVGRTVATALAAGVATAAVALAAVPLAVPVSPLLFAATGCVLAVWVIQREEADLSVAATIAILLGVIGAAGFWAGEEMVDSAAWVLAVCFGMLAATTLIVRLLGNKAPAAGVMFAGLTWITALLAMPAWELRSDAMLLLTAIALYAAMVLWRSDLYLPPAVLATSLAIVEYLDVELSGGLDDGVAMLLLAAAPVVAGLLWRWSESDLRRGLRSASYFLTPLLVLSAARATSWDAEFVLFLITLLVGSAFAVTGFARRIVGFLLVGLLFVFAATFEFIAPFISQIPAFVGFGIVGVLLLGSYFAWVRFPSQAFRERVVGATWR